MRYFLLMLFPIAMTLAQQSGPGIKLKAGVSYASPDFDALNSAFADVEQLLGYRPWGNSGLPYAVSVEARYPLFQGQWIVAEVAGGAVSRMHEEDRNLTSIWRGGAGYRYELPLLPVDVAVQGTVGMVWASISRSYNSHAAVLNAAGNSWYLSAQATGAYRLLPRASLELSLGYAYLHPFTSSTPEAEVDLKTPLAGLGIVIDL